jgi:hypothetical protein
MSFGVCRFAPANRKRPPKGRTFIKFCFQNLIKNPKALGFLTELFCNNNSISERLVVAEKALSF